MKLHASSAPGDGPWDEVIYVVSSKRAIRAMAKASFAQAII
jgi:hypothetical protein